jgi:hypothetical protein
MGGARDGHRIGQWIPLRRRRFISRQEFDATSRSAPAVDIAAFRDDQDAAVDHSAPPVSAQPEIDAG